MTEELRKASPIEGFFLNKDTSRGSVLNTECSIFGHWLLSEQEK
jgi:hypothetical protein